MFDNCKIHTYVPIFHVTFCKKGIWLNNSFGNLEIFCIGNIHASFIAYVACELWRIPQTDETKSLSRRGSGNQSNHIKTDIGFCTSLNPYTIRATSPRDSCYVDQCISIWCFKDLYMILKIPTRSLLYHFWDFHPVKKKRFLNIFENKLNWENIHQNRNTL